MVGGGPRPAGRECELFNEEVFSELRRNAQVPHDFANDGWDLDKLVHGGGKGGSLMARVGSSYMIKELSKGDHASLLKVASSYGQHVRSGETLLCPIYLHFREASTGRFFFAMRNSIGTGPFAKLYDLKGCADDKTLEEDGEPIKAVHKRVWNVGMWCRKTSWSKERRVYYDGKVQARRCEIPLAPEQRSQCLTSMERDTAWLAQNRLMDYSLLVAVKTGPGLGSADSGGSGFSGHQPMLYKSSEGQDMAVFVSIIDFLQRWTMGKRMARCVKFSECNKATVPPRTYARRFNRHFAARLVELRGGAGAATAPSPPPKAVARPAGESWDEVPSEDRMVSRPIPVEETLAPLAALKIPGAQQPVISGFKLLSL